MALGPLPAVPNVLRVSVQGLVGSRPWANVLHFVWAGAAPGAAGCFAIAEAVAAAWNANMQALQDTSTSFQACEVTDLTSDTAGQATYDIEGTGTREGDYLPASASFLVSYAVERRYRGGHPRSYLSVGVFADLDSPNTWDNDFIGVMTTAWPTFIASLLTTFTTTTLTTLAAVQYKHIDKSLVPPAEVYNDPPIVLALSADNASYEKVLGTQRRRIRKR